MRWKYCDVCASTVGCYVRKSKKKLNFLKVMKSPDKVEECSEVNQTVLG